MILDFFRFSFLLRTGFCGVLLSLLPTLSQFSQPFHSNLYASTGLSGMSVGFRPEDPEYRPSMNFIHSQRLCKPSFRAYWRASSNGRHIFCVLSGIIVSFSFLKSYTVNFPLKKSSMIVSLLKIKPFHHIELRYFTHITWTIFEKHNNPTYSTRIE